MNNMLSSYDTVTMDSATFPRIANPAPADQHANDRGQDLSMKISEAETTGGGGGSGEDAGTGGGGSKGSGGTRIKPIDTRIRLQLMKTQGFSTRSKANYGNTHMMASQPGPVNMSVAKLVESGSTFTEARKHVARATREALQRFVREGEEALAKEMSFRNLQERVNHAHTFGSATPTHKIERMHRRGREKLAGEMLERNELNELNKKQSKPRDNRAAARELVEKKKLAVSSSATSEEGSKRPKRAEANDEGVGLCSGSRGNGEGGQGECVRVSASKKAPGCEEETVHDTKSAAFVLRKLYTGGGLDAQQEGWESLPVELFNTLTMQLGTISKINMPRNSLELLISLRNPNFSCEHMRSVTEINLSGNMLAELPAEAQRLTSLRILRLDNNKLSSLPDGLLALTSLTSLYLRHNNFSALPYRFGDLRFLQKLDLGENMLKTLPSTMGLLTSLKHLKLDGNNMPHLAMPPPLKTSDGKDHSVDWAKRWHRGERKETWINQLTGETREADPKSLDRSSNASASVNGCLSVGTTAYNRRRNELAARGVYEWEAALDVSTGQVYYVNNINSAKAYAMPSCMDRLGEMTSLVTLKLSQNKLRSLPTSICACLNMEVLEVNDNYLERLPNKMGDMKRLRSLRLDINCLRELPGSLVNLSRLEELSLTSNCFATFPEFAMKMFNLKKLLLGNNQLKRLPYAVGFLSRLETLQLYNNPLADPPAELLLLGMDKMLWECRRRYWAQCRGPPPAVGVHGFGIEEEKLELQPEFERKLAKRIKKAGKTGELNFMMEGLTYFPLGLFDEEIGRKLIALRLDSNDFGKAIVPFRHTWQDLDRTTHSVSLSNLLVLSLKSCKLRGLGDDIAELSSLLELYLESNLILNLTDSFTRLRTLEVLDMKKNRLQDCPDGIGALSRLKRLELDGNRLEVLPAAVSMLGRLETLTLSSNHLYRLPNEIVGLEKLRLRLRSLKLSYNRLETLRHDLFQPALKETLQQLWLSNNNLLQLPDSLVELTTAGEVHLDSNPFKSPPCDLLAEGLPILVKYLNIRRKRIDVMQNLILERGFDTSLECLVPEACGVLTSGTAYLGLADLDEIDKAVDRYINGDFYRHPLSAEAILDVAVELRETREREFFQRMVAHLMARVMFHEKREIFSENVFCRHTTRPWGRSKGPVGCFMIASSALFEDTAPNAFVEEFRSALWSEAIKTLPQSVFDYTTKALRKALVSLRSAYGPIARFEDITFDLCECVDLKTGEELRHPRGECIVPGIVVVKIIYTAEEAERRRAEDEEVVDVFGNTRKQIQEWLKTKQGQVSVTDEMKKAKAIKRFRIGLIDMRIAELEGLTAIKNKLLAFAVQRKAQFEDGEPFHFHKLATAEEATVLVAAAENEVADCGAELLSLQLEKTKLKQALAEKAKNLKAETEENLMDKYCYVEYAEVVRRDRIRALKRGWRRPWDGMDGEDFVAWARRIKCVAAERHERPQNVAEYRLMPEPSGRRDWDESPSELTARLNWKGTESMELFLVPRLLEWKAKHAPGSKTNLLPEANEEGEDVEEDDDTDNLHSVDLGSSSGRNYEAGVDALVAGNGDEEKETRKGNDVRTAKVKMKQ